MASPADYFKAGDSTFVSSAVVRYLSDVKCLTEHVKQYNLNILIKCEGVNNSVNE